MQISLDKWLNISVQFIRIIDYVLGYLHFEKQKVKKLTK